MPLAPKVNDSEKKIYNLLIMQGLKIWTGESDCSRLNLSILFVSDTTLNKLAKLSKL